MLLMATKKPTTKPLVKEEGVLLNTDTMHKFFELKGWQQKGRLYRFSKDIGIPHPTIYGIFKHRMFVTQSVMVKILKHFHWTEENWGRLFYIGTIRTKAKSWQSENNAKYEGDVPYKEDSLSDKFRKQDRL